MRSLDFCRCALGVCVAAAMLAGCSASQPPIGAPDLMSQNVTRLTRPDAGKYRILYSFYGNYGVGGPNGGPPLSAPVLDSSGNLYGPAGGGIGNSIYCSGPCGVVYKLTRARGWSESVAINFSSWFNDGVPNSPMAFDGRGNLYGDLRLNIGRNWTYKLTPVSGGWAFTTIYKNYSDDRGGVVVDGAGNIYGLLSHDYCGTAGELSLRAKGWKSTTLYNFCHEHGRGGTEPRAPFSWDAKGNLYGTAYAGGLKCPGTYGCGTAFQMTPNENHTWTYHVLHHFGALKKDGFSPWVFDKSGSLYGVANGGNKCGAYYCGEVFKITPETSGQWKYSVVHAFGGSDGAYHYCVVIDKDGNIFGTALGGGTYNYGVVFEIAT